MKVLFVYKYCILGGVTTQLANRLMGLGKSWEMHFLFLYDYGGLSAFGEHEFKYVSHDINFFNELLNKYHYDMISVIDTEEVYKWIEACNYKGVVVTEVHTTTENIEKIKLLRQEKPMQLILTPSYYMKKLIEDKYQFKGIVPVEVVSNCIYSELFKPVERKQLEGTEKIILWVGKLDDHKRWYDFVEICRKLEYEYKIENLKYVVVGGITASQEVINRFMNQLLEEKLLHKMTWYSAIEYQEMRKIYGQVYQSGGVYVSTTVNESFGMTALEAMCMKLPMVVPEVGGLAELCEPYRKNTLYPLFDLDRACQLIINQLGKSYHYDTQKYYTDNVCMAFKEVIEHYFNDKF